MFDRVEAEEARWRADSSAPVGDALLRLISFRETRRLTKHRPSRSMHRSGRVQPQVRRARSRCGKGRPRGQATRSSARSGDGGDDAGGDADDDGEGSRPVIGKTTRATRRAADHSGGTSCGVDGHVALRVLLETAA